MPLPVENYFDLPRIFSHMEIYPQNYGELSGKHHLGEDIKIASGRPIFAPMGGIVNRYEGRQGGKTVTLKSGELFFRFLHLSEYGGVGYVSAGDLIGFTGNTGSTSKGPHLHYDLSWNQLKLQDLQNFLDPLLWHKGSVKSIKVITIGPEKPNLGRIASEYKKMGVTLKLDYLYANEAPEWETRSSDGKEDIVNKWWDINVGPVASGYDIAVLCVPTIHYKRRGTNGYANQDHANGFWPCVAENTGGWRNIHKSEWNGPDQLTGTVMHEIAHALDYATGRNTQYRQQTGNKLANHVHELDYSGKTLDMRWDLSKFSGWDIPGHTRLFRWSEYRTLESVDGKLIPVVKKTENLKRRIAKDYITFFLKPWYSEYIPELKK